MKNSQKATQTRFWIGLDVDSVKVVAATAGREGARLTFRRTCEGIAEMLEWARRQCPRGQALAVAMESTGSYSRQVHLWIAELEESVSVSILNPKVVHDYLLSLNPRRKTDEDDALGIACFASERNPARTPLLNKAQQDLRNCVRARTVLVAQRDGLRNHMATTDRDGSHQKILADQIRSLNKSIDKLETAARKIARADATIWADCCKLMEIYGVGEVTAMAILGELGDLRRFDNAKQLACYCGMTPRVVQSGRSERRPRLSKVGSPAVRRALYMAALVNIRRRKTDMAAAYQEYVERGMAKRKALVRVMRKLLDRMYLLITKGVSFECYPVKNQSAGV